MLEFESNSQVEDYLDRTCSPMIGQKPYEERAAIREELKNHLLAAISASKELGASDSEAVGAAMKLVGKPEQVARSFGIRKQTQWSSLALAASVFLFSASLWISYGQFRPTPQPIQKPLVTKLPPGAIGNMHIKWAQEHLCTECHRSTIQGWLVQNGATSSNSFQK